MTGEWQRGVIEFPDASDGWLRQRRGPLTFTVIGVFVAIAAEVISWSAYGGDATWPGLIGNFAATLAALLIALAWDRCERELSQIDAEESEYARRYAEARPALLVRIEGERDYSYVRR